MHTYEREWEMRTFVFVRLAMLRERGTPLMHNRFKIIEWFCQEDLQIKEKNEDVTNNT